jgi:hypothetical protein
MRKSAYLAMPTIVRREDGAQRSTMCEITHPTLSPSNATVYALWINTAYELRHPPDATCAYRLTQMQLPANSSAQADEPILAVVD